MALKLHTTYPGRFDSPSENYPQGKWRNRSNSTAHDGGYLEEKHMNDIYGFFGALLRNAEMSPNGEVDTAKKSQFYDALVTVAKSVVSGEGYRKLDDNVFNGLMTIKSDNGEQGVGVLLQESDGTVRGQVVATDQGLQLTQYPKDGGLQTFTFPSEGEGGEIVTDRTLLESIPIGVVKAYIGETAPNEKWLLCRGQAFSAEGYPDLAQLLPDLKIPDLRGVALRGLDANRGFDPGRTLLSYQEDAMQKLEGRFEVRGLDVADNNVIRTNPDGCFEVKQDGEILGAVISSTSNSRENRNTNVYLDSSLVTRSNTQDETVMKNVAVNFIIKAR